MLQRIRMATAAICFTLITLLFLDFTGTLHGWFGWLANIQFLPALLALNVGVILGLILLTLLLGRVYCSVICPLGVFQDAISWIAGKQKRNRFSYSPAFTQLRYGVLALFIIIGIAGINSLFALLAPYSSYGRIVSNLFSPFYLWGNNLLAYGAERAGSYAFYSVDVWMKSAVTLGIAAATFLIITILAWRGGRTYCNTICPVGTVLGFLSRYAFFKPAIDTSKCNGCGLCARNCKAACIDPINHQIDYSRCITCMNCVEKCRQKAIQYKPRKRQVETAAGSRRSFFSAATLFLVTTTVQAQKIKVDGGLTVIEEKKIPSRKTPITPAGALSFSNMTQHCTSCQLCISACPSQVLRPSSNIQTLMQPEVSYERGYCRPECTRCSEVCPTGAIHRITATDKSAIQIGHAVWIKENCIVNTDQVNCGNCFRHCPSGAILMIPLDADNPASLKIPSVDTERCIGCGACENLCPSRPLSAIYVEGHERHREI